MSSYKGHTLFGLILGLLFSFNPLAVGLAVIGANIPDFDHSFKTNQVYKIIIFGILVSFSLYVLNLPYYLGLIIIFLGVTFYFSEHRSFTHSIFGILVLAASVSLIIIWAFELISCISGIQTDYIMLILIALVSFLFLNKRVLPVFIPVLFISSIFFHSLQISYIQIVFFLFLGLISHSVLDAFSPAGVKFLAPLSNNAYHKNFAYAVVFILVVLIILIKSPFLFSQFEGFINSSGVYFL